MGGLAFAVPTIGFVAGAFDLLHPGHILMLADAADQCDHLVVGLHTDPHLERSEKSEPIQTIDERIMILQSLRFVSQIVVYTTEADLERILYELKPDVRILGSDWRGKKITAPDAAKRIHWHEREHNWSSSEMRRRVWEAEERAMFESSPGLAQLVGKKVSET
jgi:glycerol-3-phosphate cytidylyltransferase